MKKIACIKYCEDLLEYLCLPWGSHLGISSTIIELQNSILLNRKEIKTDI